MKRITFTLILLIAITRLFAQNSFREIIRNTQGTSEHFTVLDETLQHSFNPEEVKNLLGLDQNSDLVLIRTEADQIGFTHYRFYQTYMGIPVENSMYVIHTKNNLISGMSGSIVVDFGGNISSRLLKNLSDKQAIAAAVQSVHANKYAWENADMEQRIKIETGNTLASYYPKAELVWYSPGEEITPANLRLAYKVDVYTTEPLSRANYFIDAGTGEVLGKVDEIEYSDAVGTSNTYYSGTQTIHSDLYSGSYRLRDLTKGNGVITRHGDIGGNPDYTSSTANWNLTGTNQAAMDAHYGVSQTYAFYQSVFGRNSLDNNGYALNSYVNQSGTTDNAYWDGSSMHFGTRSNGANGGVTGIDVCGHELTHGVTQFTCNLNYSNQSGAMNESLSDIMGKFVQFWSKPADIDWHLSNDMNWLIRNMSNPNDNGDPDTYLGTYWYTGGNDNGGVHTNSGVGNFFAYLLVTGGTGTNDIGNAYNVTGIGISEAEQIIYRSQTVYLVATSQYTDWRTACISAATDLYGATSNEVTQVKNAWYAVGIGSGGVTCSIPSGLFASSVTTSTAVLNWSSVGGATNYNVRYRVVGNSTWTNTTSSTTSKSISGLNSSTQYEFQVQSDCGGGTTSSYSSSSYFTTVSSGVICTETGEPNNSSSTANPVSVGIDYLSQISAQGDADWFSFSNSGASNIKITLSTLPANYNIKLYNPGGSNVATSQNNGNANETIIYNTSSVGTYTVKVFGKGNAHSNSQCYTLHIYTSSTPFRFAEDEYVSTQSVNIYPVPASQTITVSLNSNTNESVTISIINMLGEKIFSEGRSVNQGENSFNLDLGSMTNGIYFLEIMSDGQLLRKQFVVSK